MRITIVTLLLMQGPILLWSQSVEQTVLSAAGGEFVNSEIHMSWTIGEPLIATLSGGPVTLTQGFHQSFLEVTGVIDHGVEVSIEVFPNPVSEMLHIHNLSDEKDLVLNLSDVTGKKIYHNPFNETEKLLDMSGLPAGIYLLTVSHRKGKRTFKILKSE